MLTRKRILASGKPLRVKVKTPELGNKDEHTYVRELTVADAVSYRSLLESVGKDETHRGIAVWVFLCSCDANGVRTFLDVRDVARLTKKLKRNCGAKSLLAYMRIAEKAIEINTGSAPAKKNHSAPRKRSRSGSHLNSAKKTRGR